MRQQAKPNFSCWNCVKEPTTRAFHSFSSHVLVNYKKGVGNFSFNYKHLKPTVYLYVKCKTSLKKFFFCPTRCKVCCVINWIICSKIPGGWSWALLRGEPGIFSQAPQGPQILAALGPGPLTCFSSFLASSSSVSVSASCLTPSKVSTDCPPSQEPTPTCFCSAFSASLHSRRIEISLWSLNPSPPLYELC